MTRIPLIQLSILFFLVQSAAAQKVKYKDLYGLLSTKQYEAAEPFLKRYLKENTDNPNAYLFMGIIYHEKSSKDDVLKQTPRAIAHMDSAIQFYDKAYKTITERELKRNSEYYQAYNRRDLRTGEFGVKLSDIQFDLEKKIEGLRARIDQVKSVKRYFALADSLYKRSHALFVSIREAYPGEKEFYLRADEETLTTLAVLAQRYDSAIKAFDLYKTNVSGLGKIGYNHTLSVKEIRSLKTDGAEPSDFYKDEIVVWDYKEFATRVSQILQKDLLPMRQHLIAYDIEINKLREKLMRDSVSVKNDLTKLIDRILLTQLKKYDDHPLPMDLFSLKIAELEYRSSLIDHKQFRDSSDLHLHIRLTLSEIAQAAKLDSLCSRVVTGNLDSRLEDYAHFVKNTFNNPTVLKSFVRSMQDYAVREKQAKYIELAARQEGLRWIVQASDSIPLFLEGVSARFKPLHVMPEKFTTGLKFIDSLNAEGYLFSITPSRKPDVKVSFPVDKGSFKQARLPYIRNIAYTDGNSQIFFVLLYSQRANKDKTYPVTVAKIYRSDGLAWSNNYAIPFLPAAVDYRPETGELLVYAENGQVVIDKNGKVLKK